jgi:hypothetical protein
MRLIYRAKLARIRRIAVLRREFKEKKQTMNITIKRELNDVNWEELSLVFERVQWGKRDPEALRRAYHKSFACLLRL